MSCRKPDELEARVQELIEAAASAKRWRRAFGRVQPQEDGTFEDRRIDTKNSVAAEPIDNFLEVQAAVEDLLGKVGARGCTYHLEAGGPIRFSYTD